MLGEDALLKHFVEGEVSPEHCLRRILNYNVELS